MSIQYTDNVNPKTRGTMYFNKKMIVVKPLLFSLLLFLNVIFLRADSGGIYENPYQLLTAEGIVFHDIDGSGVFNHEVDIPLEGVAVSNGREVVYSGSDGSYLLPLRDPSAIFVIKPANWTVPTCELNLPRFYYFYNTGKLSGDSFEGLQPTGSLPSSLDFPLYPSEEPDAFEVLVFGDTQPRDDREIHYIAHDVVTELIGSDAAFGVTLGDVVFDDLDLYDHINRTIATIGIPWRNVLGNHDIDFSADDDTNARGAFYRTFGPSYYSFSYGTAHFIVLDNIRWITEGSERYYRTGLGEDQMTFLRNELTRTGNDTPVFILAHIPWYGPGGGFYWQYEEERDELYELLAEYPNSVSLVSHHHKHYHLFLDREHGFPGEEAHHMISVGSVCGAWWTGVPDEYGIPHAMMSDGTPTSYTKLHIDGGDWKLGWKAARRPSDFQMHIHAPDRVTLDQLVQTTVTANIFNALPDATVRMRIRGVGDWKSMQRVRRNDPVRVAALEWEETLSEISWRPLSGQRNYGHIWEVPLPSGLQPGVYVIDVQASDMWWNYSGSRIVRVE